ncbi:hypothetical protein [Agromyces larvae]|uniref:Uncharacterized protein n=1 Tax=Agromyces larvae TaxID=2929802 RepID=A0ABY4C398_9MICO|nr:hypothetical protein [Agromyces larvae]UOE45953.1 hypothetical protein MTO99_09490 [Agromyces larvae]
MAERVTPKLSTIAHVGTLANQRAYRVNVTYPGEPTRSVSFVGTDGDYGTVVMVMHDGSQHRVTDPGRFGAFGPEWVRRFYA